MENLNCLCPNKECPAHGECKACRALHKNRKTYCQSDASQKAFMNFAFKIYFLKKLINGMISREIKKM
ncbi:hypothetical protein FACS189485_19550 [Spirochaetia bacterium]|nr:hypothetical protein FACS189485_19550 [Spirochaetia bacterium]